MLVERMLPPTDRAGRRDDAPDPDRGGGGGGEEGEGEREGDKGDLAAPTIVAVDLWPMRTNEDTAL